MQRLIRDEEGATTILLALCTAMIFGFVAISVDVGHIYAERRELQNGADAAVLSMALDCADDDVCTTRANAGTTVDPYATAETYADANAEDSAAAVANPGGIVISAPSSGSPGKITVRATSEDAGGNGFITNWFAGVLGMLNNDPSIATTQVEAKAAAIWGPIVFGSLPEELPLTFSKCEYDRFLAAGVGHATAPWTAVNNGPSTIIKFHTGNGPAQATDCAAGPGQDTDGDGRLPGGFGWLDNTGTCSADISGAGFVGEDPGAAPDQGACSPQWVRDHIYQKVIILPVFDDVNGLGGNNGNYHVYTYAAFYVSGYSITGQYKEREAHTGAFPCSGQTHCISGWFTQAATDGGEIDPGGSGDVRTIQMVLE